MWLPFFQCIGGDANQAANNSYKRCLGIKINLSKNYRHFPKAVFYKSAEFDPILLKN